MKTKRTPHFLMANLGSEVSKLYSFVERGEEERAQKTLVIAENILNEIMKFPEMLERKGELEILSQALQDIVKKKDVLKITPQHLKSYFHPFAMRLMKIK